MRQAAQETQRQQLLRFCKWPRATDSTVCRLAVTVPGKRGWDSLLCPTAPPPRPVGEAAGQKVVAMTSWFTETIKGHREEKVRGDGGGKWA